MPLAHHPAVSMPTVLCAVATLLLCVCCQGGSPSLTDPAFVPFPIGSITPTGWLLKQLTLQAEGLSGHLSSFWPDIADSIWIGGANDGDLHERTPYWLNGIVPLTYLLRNAEADRQSRLKASRANGQLCQEGVDMMFYDLGAPVNVDSAQTCHDNCLANPRCRAFVVDDCTSPMQCWLKGGIEKSMNASCRCLGYPDRPVPDLTNQTYSYLNYILDNQDPKSGWLGPTDNVKDGNTYWSRFPLLLSLLMWAEAEPEVYDRVTESVMKFMNEMLNRITTSAPLQGWSSSRWMDFVLSIQWMLDHYAPQGSEDELTLLKLSKLSHDQGVDWESWFGSWEIPPGLQYQIDHGVNNAQALKSAAVWYRSTGNSSLADLSLKRLHDMDKTFGMPNGMFCADETMCLPIIGRARNHPSRGSELCAVVEAMYSYETMFSVHGETSFADRAERIAFNALPATWASETGGDMWNHQYLQATNEISAASQAMHIWPNDGPDAEMYGLEPNFGCCTANFNQGWPKFASNLFYTTPAGDAVVVGVYAPAKAQIPSGGTIEVETDYPFEDTIKITLTIPADSPLTTLIYRVPGWATQATASVNGGDATMVAAGMMLQTDAVVGGTTTVVLNLNPAVTIESWYPGAVSVHRGPLLFSANIEASYTPLMHYLFDSYDLEVVPLSTAEWRWSLDIDPSVDISTQLVFKKNSPSGSAPFNHTGFPVQITAPVRVTTTWSNYMNSLAEPPMSPSCTVPQSCKPRQQIVLVPYGCTDLRVTQMPIASFAVPDLPPNN